MNDKELRDVAGFAGLNTKIYNDRGEPIEPKNPDILRIKLLEPDGSMAIMKAFLGDGTEFNSFEDSRGVMFIVSYLKNRQEKIGNFVAPTLNEAVLSAAIEYVKTRTDGGQDDNR